ncbi:MAG: PepSY protein [Nocardioides sp.]|jgi:uncharacterized membrane protein YkoI|uniref:PepSY domain-containing protein n=1 Tax=Nocardioides sp. TaxID=35761 RepID=UPI002629D16F|nr:PepSY domain-containing protein [Nocardioides sp.]MCW2835223.1 PepSY protein [Nocardioides sp.]
MNRSKQAAAAAAAAIIVVGGAGAAVAGASGDDDASDTPIQGPALERAEEAALEETGGGTVTETEVGDEESYYEVEVTLDNGDQVDVQLDRDFTVVGSEEDSEAETDD